MSSEPRELGSPDLVDDVIDAMERCLRGVPGFRRGHARGVSFRGHFSARPAAAALTTAEHMQGDRVETVVRLSNGAVCPYDPDRATAKRGNPLGIGVRFELASGGHTTCNALSLTGFAPRDAEDFLRITEAQKPALPGNQANPLRLVAFALPRPRAIQGIKAVATLPTTQSFATTRFNGLHAYRAVDAAGERVAFRMRFVPLHGVVPLAPEDDTVLPPQYLVSEIKARIERGPIAWDLVFQIANPGDPTDDIRRQWPEDRRQVTVGRLIIDRLHEDQDAADAIVYDPTNVPPGIELSDDPMLHFRRHAYAESFRRRTSERKPEIRPE